MPVEFVAAMFDFRSKPMSRRQVNRLALLAIIALMLPAYGLGILLLIEAPSRHKAAATPTASAPDPAAAPPVQAAARADPPTSAPTLTGTFTPTVTATPTATPIPTDPPTPTPLPSDTPLPTDLPTPTPIPTDLPTPVPTATPVPATLTPTSTPIPTETLTPAPTSTPSPTRTPTSTRMYLPPSTLTPLPSATATLRITPGAGPPGVVSGSYSLWGCTANVGSGTPPLLNPINPAEASYTWVQGVWAGVHDGIDVAIPTGTPVHAAGGGTVVFAGWSTLGYGNAVVIAHGATFSLYGHLSEIDVKCDQVVGADTVIGLSGTTGWSSGPHLHFEIRDANWGVLDPKRFIEF